MPEEKELIFKEEPDLPEDDTIIDEEPVANTGRKVKIDWFENNIWHGKTGYVVWEDPTDDSDLATVTVNITDFPSEDGLKEVEQNFERRRVVDYSEDEPVEVPEEGVEIEEPIHEEQPVEESLKEDNENTPTTYFLDCSGSFRSNPDHNWPQEMREIKNSSGNAKVFYFASFIYDNKDDAKMDGGSQGYFKIIDYAKKHPEEKCIVRTDDDYKTMGADELEALPNVELRITLEPRHEEQPVEESLDRRILNETSVAPNVSHRSLKRVPIDKCTADNFFQWPEDLQNAFWKSPEHLEASKKIEQYYRQKTEKKYDHVRTELNKVYNKKNELNQEFHKADQDFSEYQHTLKAEAMDNFLKNYHQGAEKLKKEPIPEEQPVKESLKEEAMYGLFVEVKNSYTGDIIEAKRKLMVGTKEECEDKKKHLEEVSNGVGNHINNYTVEFLGNSSYDNPSNPDKVITPATTVYYIAGDSPSRLTPRLLYVKDPKYDETLKVRYGTGFGFDDAVLYFLSEKEAQEFLNAIKAGNFENADKLTGVRAKKPLENATFSEIKTDFGPALVRSDKMIKTDFGIAAVKSDKMIGQKRQKPKWADHIAKLFDLDVKEDLEETFYIVAFDNVSTDQGDNFFNKEGIPGNHDRLWHWVDKENATKYQTREEAEKDIELAKDLFAEQCEFVSGEKPMFFEVGNYEEDNAVRVEVLSEDELAGFGFNESLKENKAEKNKYYVIVWDGKSDYDEDLGAFDTLKEAEQAAKDAVELDGYAVAEVHYKGELMRHFGLGESLKEAKEEHECCICHKKFKGFGNNAEPVCDGICCDECNWRVVIPARVKEYEAGPSDIDFDDEMFEDCENCREHTAIPDDDDVDFTW